MTVLSRLLPRNTHSNLFSFPNFYLLQQLHQQSLNLHTKVKFSYKKPHFSFFTFHQQKFLAPKTQWSWKFNLECWQTPFDTWYVEDSTFLTKKWLLYENESAIELTHQAHPWMLSSIRELRKILASLQSSNSIKSIMSSIFFQRFANI